MGQVSGPDQPVAGQTLQQPLVHTQTKVYLLQGNLSSQGEPSTDPFHGWDRDEQRNTWAEKLFFPVTSSSDSLSDPVENKSR